MKPFRVVVLSSITAVLAFASSIESVFAQAEESFESPEATTRIIERDCAVRVDIQKRTLEGAHSGNACEHVRLVAGQGTKVYLAQPVPAAPVISELVPSIWVRSDRSGLQLLARVVLPRTLDPDTGRPMVAYIHGDSYSEVRLWQRLDIEQALVKLERQARILRDIHKVNVESREAYIDHLVLNAYGGRGVTNIWLDDLRLVGYANAGTLGTRATPTGFPSHGDVARTGWQQPTSHPTRSRVQGSMLVVDDKPFFARVIEYNGESFSWLKSLGFNSVQLRSPPTPSQLGEAEQLGLWIVAPPPPRLDQDEDMGRYHRVIAWSGGARLAPRDRHGIRDLAAYLHRSADRTAPLICSTSRDAAALSHIVDLVLIERSVISTSFSLSEFTDWLRTQATSMAVDKPFWTSIPTQVRSVHLQQRALMGAPSESTPAVASDQVWLLAYHAAAAGARGVVFRSHSRLDRQDATNKLRAATLKLINHELVPIEPWCAAGSYAGTINASDPQIQAHMLQTQRARLLIAIRNAADQQFVVGPYQESGRYSLFVRGIPITDRAYHLGFDGLKPLQGDSTSAVSLPVNGLASVVVLTQDPLATNHIARNMSRVRESSAQLHHELANIQLEEAESVARSLAVQGRTNRRFDDQLRHASALVTQSHQLLGTGDHPNTRIFAERAMNQLRAAQQDAWQQATQAFPSPVSSPLCGSFATLPAHWSMIRSGVSWRPSSLVGGGFEDLDQLLTSEWKQNRNPQPGVEADVELSLDDPRSGRSSLRMQAWGKPTNNAQLVGQWPVRIETAPIYVARGQLVRIHGFVKVPRRISGSYDGVMIFDSLGGPELAECVAETRGWQEFTLYRAAPSEGQLTISFALTGLGEAFIDDVSVSVSQ